MEMEALLKSTFGSVPLKDEILTIGRSPNNGLFINHATVSRHHAEVRPLGQGYWIIDLGSTSGTFVNGERLASQTPRLLRAGDALQVGSVPLAYEERNMAAHLESPVPLSPMRPSAPDWSLPEMVTRSGDGGERLPTTVVPGQKTELAVSEILSLSPVSDGLLPATSPLADERAGASDGEPADGLPEPAASVRPVRKVAPANSSPAPSHIAPLNLAQQQLQFTAFYPRAIPVESWNELFVYAHLEAALEAVRADARRLQAGAEEDAARSALPIAQGMQITVIPVFQGVTFQPERRSFTWTSDWHPTSFRFSADRRWTGARGTGEILLLAGPLIIAALRISLHFEEAGAHLEPDCGEVSVARYKNIFTSYCPDDRAVGQAIRQAYEALGDEESFLDIEALRASQNWSTTLPRAIESADVFQLFWSTNAAQSQCVYQECQYALQHYKYDGFIRPVYWEKPLEFAPPELSHLHFTCYEFSNLSPSA